MKHIKSIVFNIFEGLIKNASLPGLNDIMKRGAYIFFLFLTVQAFGQGQGGINSPFTRFGIGDIASEAPMFLQQMGGISTSFIDGYHINFDNPASLGYLSSTAFDIATEFKRSTISDENNTSNQWSGNLSYLSFAFPLQNSLNDLFSREKKKLTWGMGFGLLPNSTVSYSISNPDFISNGQQFTRNFSGQGGSWKAVWDNSVRYKEFSLGASLGWLFGNIEYSRNIEFTNEITAFNNSSARSYSMRGFYSKVGFSYLKLLNKAEMTDNIGREAPNTLAIGLTYKPQIGINTESTVEDINTNFILIIVDTLNFATALPGTGTLPAELAFGATYSHQNKYAIGFDFKRIFWSKYRNEANVEAPFEDTYRFAIGGYYRPNFEDNNILNRTMYKWGFYTEQDPRSIQGERISTYGITVGAGLPLIWQRKISKVDIGLDFGKRSVSNILKENFVRVTFGFTFNEADWFIKRKYN